MSAFRDVRVVGMHFRPEGAKQLAASLTPAEAHRIRLEREADNPHDPNAIKVLVEEFHIGYVNREDAAWLAGELDDEHEAVEISFVGFEHSRNNQYPILNIEVS